MGPNQISEWKQQLQDSVADVLGRSPRAKPDLKVLHTKIGQPTLGNDPSSQLFSSFVLKLNIIMVDPT